MDNKTLAIKYRPKDWDDLTEQKYIKTILQNQIETGTIKNAYLFTGPAGCGKTTSARIFANKINKGNGLPIEIDAASNNGVEQVRTIIDDAKFKPLDCDYKIYIMDECHMLSNGAWNAMLKLLEEPPKTTIFILCTTDPQKIPNTILSRVQRFDFQKISLQGIIDRLKYIITKENTKDETDNNLDNFITYEDSALQYIAKISEGGMRTAISYLDKCLSYSTTLGIENVVKALGISDYDVLSSLFDSIISKDSKKSIEIIEEIYNQGKDLKLFIKQFIRFILDICKYQLYHSYDYIQIPNTIDIDYSGTDYNYILRILESMIEINNLIKYDTNPKVIIESKLILMNKNI